MCTILYADYELDTDDMFVITPEGNYFNFPYPEYNENSDDLHITDPKSHRTYIIKFNE